MKSKKLEPLLNRCVLRLIKQKTEGIIEMAPSNQKAADRAEVLAVGPGMLNVETQEYVPSPLKIGDVVLINPLYGVRAKLNGDDVIVQRDDEILCREVDAGE